MSHTRIMVVDDDEGARLAMQKLLGGEGFVVDLAESGTSAARKVREAAPDVVLTDLQMPEMDGIALCRALHDWSPDLPVIVVTAFADLDSAVNALRAGAEDYLLKPVDFETMLLTIKRALERRAAKIEREQLRARAQELYQQTLSAVHAHEEILSIVSHDLRNPLGVILMAAKLLAGCEQERDVQAVAARITRGATRMQRLIADLLDESRIRSGHLRLEYETHSLSQLLADLSELRPLAQQKRIHLDIRPPDPDRLLCCDRTRVSQVLDNLVANAVKFSPQESTVSIFADDTREGVRFAIRDEGPGIAADALPKIFDRFWQSKAGGRTGVGLGLYIVKAIVKAHGGHVWVESQLGFGSTFYVVLPRSLAPVRPA